MIALDLLAFNAVLAAAILSPGPAPLFALRTALADGRARAQTIAEQVTP